MIFELEFVVEFFPSTKMSLIQGMGTILVILADSKLGETTTVWSK